jgi:hypothetical protein
MLDPRRIGEQREEILTSCRKRGVKADVDAVISAQEQVASCQTALNQINRQRNEHQKAGKAKLEAAARESHLAEGRRLKEAVAEHENRLKQAQSQLERPPGESRISRSCVAGATSRSSTSSRSITSRSESAWTCWISRAALPWRGRSSIS